MHATEDALTSGDEERQAPAIPLSLALAAVRGSWRARHPYVFTNSRTEERYTVNSARHVFRRAVIRAGIDPSDVALHTLRHTALSRMIDQGYDDYTGMALSGHSSTRMLARYTHPTDARKVHALDSFAMITKRSQSPETSDDGLSELKDLLGKIGGRREDRTPDLRVANAFKPYNQLAFRDIHVTATLEPDGEDGFAIGPKHLLNDDDRQQLRQHRDAIVAVLHYVQRQVPA